MNSSQPIATSYPIHSFLHFFAFSSVLTRFFSEFYGLSRKFKVFRRFGVRVLGQTVWHCHPILQTFNVTVFLRAPRFGGEEAQEVLKNAPEISAVNFLKNLYFSRHIPAQVARKLLTNVRKWGKDGREPDDIRHTNLSSACKVLLALCNGQTQLQL